MISKNAWTCPKCGAPNFLARKKVIFLVVVFAILWISYEFYSTYLKWKDVEKKENELRQLESEAI